MVELTGAQLPIDTFEEPAALVEKLVDEVGLRISAPREAHQREGHEKFTLAAIIAEEEQILEMADATDTRARLDLRDNDVGDLSDSQQRAIHHIAVSPFLVRPLQAPAGAGKTHSLRALSAAAHRTHKNVLVLAPTGKAVDEAMADGAGDHGLTVAKALALIDDRRLRINRSTLVVVDEASMVGTPDLHTLVTCAMNGRAKIVLVGDPHQLSPVNARGGMFEQLCTDLPWSQRLTEVWRMTDPQERDASLALRAARGNRLRTAVKWYRDNGRLRTGDPIAMAADALDAYLADRMAGKDALLICDTWEIADALNRRLHNQFATAGPTVSVARDQSVASGGIVVTRRNDSTINVRSRGCSQDVGRTDQVRNGNRWRVAAIDPDANRVVAEDLSDGARAVFGGDNLKEHVTLGYATTVHSAQGITADSSYAVLGGGASRAMLYVAMSRGRDSNEAFLYQRPTNEADHQHSRLTIGEVIHTTQHGNKYSAAQLFRTILANDDRPRTVHTEAERTDRCQLTNVIADLLDRKNQRRRARWAAWREQCRANEIWLIGLDRMASETASCATDRSATTEGVQL